MLMDKTFAIIKPRAFEKNLTGPILNMISTAGFRIAAIKSLKLKRSQAEKLYDIHHGKPFYDQLVDYMTSGPIIVMVLEKDNAIQDFRDLIGYTDPEEAGPGTIRRLYGLDKTQNAVHAADSPESFEKEMSLFFKQEDLV
jgi:nucleoside-diphosphate kinase